MKPRTQEWREKISKAKLGEKNPNWKGDKASYGALHSWLRVRKPRPNKCERCKEKYAIDLANISGKYQRDINDFEWLCRSCHMKGDGRIEKLLINSHTEKVRKKIGLANRGKIHTTETREKMSLAHKGQPNGKLGTKQSEETKRKISMTLKGRPPWNRGKKLERTF